jgi:phosphatidylserine synthase
MSIARTRRPKIVSAVCIVGFVWMIFVLPGMFSPSVKKLGDWMPAIYGLILAFNFISLIGAWHMKRWGAEMYILVFFLKLIFFILTKQVGFGTFVGIVFSTWFIIVFLIYYKRMDRNL